MNSNQLNILLADDDTDDCLFFKQALEKLPLYTHLNTVHDGEQLMKLLVFETNTLPDVLFLDLNMPRKSGFECLAEIKHNEKLKLLPVIVFSTSYDHDRVTSLYQNGAQYFMRKPAAFSQLKNIIHLALTQIALDLSVSKTGHISQSIRENFVLLGENSITI